MSRAPMFGVILAGKLYGREPVMVIPARTPCRMSLKLYFRPTPRYHLGGTGKSCVTRWWRSVDPGGTRSGEGVFCHLGRAKTI